MTRKIFSELFEERGHKVVVAAKLREVVPGRSATQLLQEIKSIPE